MIDLLINTIESFVTIDADEKAAIQQLFKTQRLKKGEYFLMEGKICSHVGFLAKGLVRYYINHDGEDKTYSFGEDNEFVCDNESFIPRLPSRKNIQALEDCELLRISYGDLQLFYRTIRQGERFGRLVTEQIFIQAQQELTSFYTDSPEKRYELLLRSRPGLQQRISQYHIASYVGVKPQSLSRIRKRIAQ